MRWLRAAAIAAGLVLVATATWNAIDAKSLSGAQLATQLALAGGISVGAIIVAVADLRFGLIIVVAMFCGEAFQLLQTAERSMLTREETRSTIADGNTKRTRAQSRLKDAEARLGDHDKSAVDKIATKECRSECRALLQDTRAALARDIEAARREVGDAPAVRSSSPLADALGIVPWVYDLLVVTLFAFGLNGLAVALIVWGAHRPRPAALTNVIADGDRLTPDLVVAPSVEADRP